MRGKRIYETDAVKAFYATMSAASKRKAARLSTHRQVLVRVSFGAGESPTFAVPTKRELAMS